MKKLIFTCLMLLFSLMLFGQINYQAQYSQSPDTVISVEINILDLTENGNIIFKEDHSPHTNENGLFTISIGEGTYEQGHIDSINWQTPKYISISIDGEQVGNTARIMFVPTSLFSKTSEKQIIKRTLVEDTDYEIIDTSSYNKINLIEINNLISATYVTVNSSTSEIRNGSFEFGAQYNFLDYPMVYSMRTIYVHTEDGMYKIVL